MCAVEKALPQVVPSVTAEGARQLFHASRQKGAALVIVAVKVYKFHSLFTPASFSSKPTENGGNTHAPITCY